jgi:hypothetical protein
MPTEKTEVLYDVSKAEKELKKLDKSVVKSGKKAKSSFGDASGGVKQFGGVLSIASPQAAGFASQMTTIGAALAPISPAVVGVTGAVVAATAAFVDWGEAGRTAIQNIEAAASTAAANIERIDVLSAQETAEATRGLKQELRDLAQTAADRRVQDARIKQEQATLQTTILQRKAALSQIEDAERESGKIVADIRDRALSGGGATGAQLNRQIQDILSLASRVGREGDPARQQRLLDDARKLAERADRPDFFTQRILQQERGIAGDRGQPGPDAADIKERKTALQDEIKELQTRNKELSIASQEILAAAKLDKARRSRVSEDIKRIESESDIADAIGRQNERLLQGNQVLQTRLGLLERVKQGFQTGASIAFGEGRVTQAEQFGQIQRQFESGQRGLQAAERGDIEGLKQALVEIDEEQKKINDAKSRNDFTTAYKVREDGVKALRATIVEAIKEQSKLDEALGGVTTERAQQIQRGEAATPLAPRAAEQPVRDVKQEILIQIQGLGIDESMLQALVDKLRRELRKDTNPGV